MTTKEKPKEYELREFIDAMKVAKSEKLKEHKQRSKFGVEDNLDEDTAVAFYVAILDETIDTFELRIQDRIEDKVDTMTTLSDLVGYLAYHAVMIVDKNLSVEISDPEVEWSFNV